MILMESNFSKEEFSEEENHPLTKRELLELRKILEQDRRARWLWSTVRLWAAWFSGVVLAIITLHEKIRDFFKSIFS